MSKFYKQKDVFKGIPKDLYLKLVNLDYSDPEIVKAVILELFALVFQSMEIYRSENEVIVNYINQIDKILKDSEPLTNADWFKELRETTNKLTQSILSK